MHSSRKHECASRLIGKQSELVVRRALEFLKKLGLIASFMQKDQPGIDFFITFKDSRTVPLQVKSSRTKAAEHANNHPDVAVIIVRHNFTQIPPRDFERLARDARNNIARVLHLSR